MSVMLKCYSLIIDCGISATGHRKEVVNGINATEKRYIYQLISIVQLPVSKTFDSQIQCSSPRKEKNSKPPTGEM